MSMPNAVTSGSNAVPRNAAAASTAGAESADSPALDFAALLMGLGAADGLETEDARALSTDDPSGSATPMDASTPAFAPQPALPPEALRPDAARGAEWMAGASMAQAGAARAQAAGSAEAATDAEALTGVAGLGDGRVGGRKAASQLPNLLKQQVAYAQRMNAAQGGAVEAGSAGANAHAGNARAASLAATAAAARGDDGGARLNQRGAETLLASQAQAPTVSLTSVSTTAVMAPDIKRDLWGADRPPVTADWGLGAAGVMGASGAATSQSVVSVAPDAGLTTQMQVAEQVSYWVGQGVQNAEMEVRGLAENPIQVSIDLQGVEAHVAFRAEQPETRQVLQDAVPHLREMLEREGLVLSGVSVGVNGGDDRPGRQAKGQDEGRRVAQVRAAPVAAAAGPVARPRAGGSSGGSVDLFV